MNDPATTIAIPGLIQNRILNKVAFAAEGITIRKPVNFNSRVFIPDENIAAFRFGIKRLSLNKLELGNQYFIEIKDFKGEIYRIVLNSCFGFKRKTYYNVWADLLQNLWDHYIDRQLSYYVELYNMQMEFELAGVVFQPDGVVLNKKDKLKWNEITTKSYQNYFLIQHINDPGKYRCCLFSVEWNAVILQSLLKEIVKEYTRVSKKSSL
jgi:hypothetical protein